VAQLPIPLDNGTNWQIVRIWKYWANRSTDMFAWSTVRSIKHVEFLAVSLAGTAAIAALGGTVVAAEKTSKPKISMAQARVVALKLAPGKITDSEYEKDGGGWRYSFDIRQNGHIQEIGIDGQTGKVVENKSEGKVDHD
jgi:hypothetical protein